MIVIFDTNIWLRNLYLRSPAGAAARFYIIQKKARVALPEVIRLEVEHHLRSDMRSYVAKIRDNHKRLLAIFGELKELVLPTDDEIEKVIFEAFGSLEIDFLEVPFSFESARDSFLRTISKRPPSDPSQQFKDGVIWADCISLLKQDDIVFVTDDLAFYEGRDASKGLAAVLRDECKSTGHSLTLLSQLSDLLNEIRSDVAIDQDALAAAFLQSSGDSVRGLLDRNGFTMGERTGLDAKLFVTEKPQILFLEFQMTFRCLDISGKDREASLKVQGDGAYDSVARTFSGIGELSSELKFINEEGVSEERRNIVLRAGGITLGHRNVSHTVRHKLDLAPE